MTQQAFLDKNNTASQTKTNKFICLANFSEKISLFSVYYRKVVISSKKES